MFYQLKTGHALTGEYSHWTTNRPNTKCWWRQYKNKAREHPFEDFQTGSASRRRAGRGRGAETLRGKDRSKIRDLLVYECCSTVVLDFLEATDAGGRRCHRWGKLLVRCQEDRRDEERSNSPISCRS